MLHFVQHDKSFSWFSWGCLTLLAVGRFDQQLDNLRYVSVGEEHQ
jgi:hypothetical protein